MSFNTQDHFDLFRVLSKLVSLGNISTDEMETLLTKSGLTKIGDSTYRDESGAILEM